MRMGRDGGVGRTGQIAILVNHLGNPFEASLVSKVETEVRERGYTLLLHTCRSDLEQELAAMLIDRIDGLVLLGQTLQDTTVAMLQERAIPIVSLLKPAWDHNGIEHVDLDWLQVMRKTIEYLQSRGHHRIGFMANGNPAHYHTHRLSAFIQAMKLCKAEFQHDYVISGGGTYLKAYDAMEQFLRSRDLAFTALVCANDLMAIGALAACRNNGVRVPGQLAIIGCEDILMSSETNPPLTTIQYARDTLAQGAVRLLFAKIDGGEADIPKADIPQVEGYLLIRSSG